MLHLHEGPVKAPLIAREEEREGQLPVGNELGTSQFVARGVTTAQRFEIRLYLLRILYPTEAAVQGHRQEVPRLENVEPLG